MHEPLTVSAAGGSDPIVTVVAVPREMFYCWPETIKSLYENTSAPFELVIVDGNSQPQIQQEIDRLAASHDNGIRVLRTEHWVTPNRARNLGLAEVTTEFVVFVDNDVIFTPGWLEPLLACAQETGATAVSPVICQFEPAHEIVHWAGGHTMEPAALERFLATPDEDLDAGPPFPLDEKIYHQGIPLNDERTPSDRRQTGALEFHCCLIRREHFDRAGPLDEDMLSTKENLDLALVILRQGGRLYLEPESVVTYAPFRADKRYGLSDLRSYLLRWNERWHGETLDHLMQKWNLADDEFFERKRRWIPSFRRAGIIADLLTHRGRIPKRIQGPLIRLLLSPLTRAAGLRMAKRYDRAWLGLPSRQVWPPESSD